MSQPASQFFDAFDWHPYRLGGHEPGPEVRGVAGPPVREEIQMVASRFGGGKPLWNTEFGWKIESKFAPEYTIYHAQAPASWDPPGVPPHREEDQAIYYVQEVAMASANSVEATFYYQFDEGPMCDRWSYGMVDASQRHPKAFLFSVATMARNTDFSETIRQENLLDTDVWLTTFSRAGTETLLIYKAAGAVDVQIAVKDNTPVVVEDVYGNRFSLDLIDGKAFLTITQSPLYIMRQRTDVTISNATFHLVSHAETVTAGAVTTSLSLTGTVPSALTSGVLQAGFLSTNSTGTLGQGMNAVVQLDAMVNEWYDAVLWLKAGTQVVGRLLSVVYTPLVATSSPLPQPLPFTE